MDRRNLLIAGSTLALAPRWHLRRPILAHRWSSSCALVPGGADHRSAYRQLRSDLKSVPILNTRAPPSTPAWRICLARRRASSRSSSAIRSHARRRQGATAAD